MTVKLTESKCQKISDILNYSIKNKNRITIREFSKLLGMLEAALPGIRYGRLLLFHSIKPKNAALNWSKGSYDTYFKLSHQAVQELNWWKQNITISYNTTSNKLPTFTIFSDACPNGWGIACGSLSSGGHWTKLESKLHINVSELLAASYALRIYCKNMLNTSVLLKMDNASALAWINQQTAPALKDYIFTGITKKFGKPPINLFASRANYKLKRIYSYYPDPLAAGMDTFFFDWLNEINVFPQFNLIPRVLQKLEHEKAEGILVVPIFVNRSWFTRLLTLLIDKPLWLPSSDISLTFPYRRKTIPTRPKTKLMTCHVSGIVYKNKEFRMRSQKLLSNPGDQEPYHDTIRTYQNGLTFVVKGTLNHTKQI